jgi:hypothetical protein
VARAALKDFHDAAVDQNAGWLGYCALRRQHEYIGCPFNEPQDHRPAGDKFEGLSLERLALLKNQAYGAQGCELSRRAHTEDAVAQVKLTRKCQYAGPAGLCDLLGTASKFPSPAPKQRTVRLGQHLWRVKSGSVVDQTS